MITVFYTNWTNYSSTRRISDWSVPIVLDGLETELSAIQLSQGRYQSHFLLSMGLHHWKVPTISRDRSSIKSWFVDRAEQIICSPCWMQWTFSDSNPGLWSSNRGHCNKGYQETWYRGIEYKRASSLFIMSKELLDLWWPLSDNLIALHFWFLQEWRVSLIFVIYIRFWLLSSFLRLFGVEATLFRNINGERTLQVPPFESYSHCIPQSNNWTLYSIHNI